MDNELLELAKVTRQLGYNLDIEWHTNVSGNPQWKIKVSHPSISDDKFITYGSLQTALKEMYVKLPHSYKSTPTTTNETIEEKKAFIRGWNASIDKIKKHLGWRSMDVDGNWVTFEVQKMQQYLTCIRRTPNETSTDI